MWGLAFGGQFPGLNVLVTFRPLLPSLRHTSPPTHGDETQMHHMPFLTTTSSPQIFATPFPSQCTQLTSELSPLCQSFWSRKREFSLIPPLSSSVLAAGRSTSHLSVLLCFTFQKSGRARHYHLSATWWRTVSADLPNSPSSVFSVGAEAFIDTRC